MKEIAVKPAGKLANKVTFVTKGRALGIPVPAVVKALGSDIPPKTIVYFRAFLRQSAVQVTLVLEPSFDAKCAEHRLASWRSNDAGKRLYVSSVSILRALSVKEAEIGNAQLDFKVVGNQVHIPIPKKIQFEETP
jgi:hypothetical protein